MATKATKLTQSKALGQMRLAAFLAATGQVGIFLKSLAYAIIDGFGHDRGDVSLPPSWALTAARTSGGFLVGLAAGLIMSLRMSAGSFRALWRIIRGDA